MPQPVLNNIVRLAVEGRLAGQQMINVHHFLATVDNVAQTITTDIMAALLEAWDASCRPALMAAVSNDYTLVKLSARSVIAPVIGQDAVFTTPYVGGRPFDTEATQVACVVSWRTGFIGRRHRGRTYIAGVPNEDMNNGLIGAPGLARVGNYAGSLRFIDYTGSPGYRFSQIILSDPSMLLPDTTVPSGAQVAPTWDFVTSYIVRDVPGVIRKRRIGVGS